MKHIISTEDLEKKIVEEILLRAENMEQACKEGKIEKLLKDKIIACIFLNHLPGHDFLLRQQP